MALPAAVHVKNRPFCFSLFSFPVAFHKHPNRDEDQPDNQDRREDDEGKHPIVWIIVTGKQRLDKKNDDKYEAVNGKNSPNNAYPVRNRFWHLHSRSILM